jgi:hypothetical protein
MKAFPCAHFLGRALRELGYQVSDAGPLRQVIREDEQERLHICRSDRRGRWISLFSTITLS